jgi:flagellar biosynthesis protein FlhA
MAAPTTIQSGFFAGVRQRDLIVPVGLVGILGLMIVPLPTLALDGLLAINITLSLVVLLTAVQIRRAMDFSVFPTLLLITTLFRLALNVSTTRLILLHGSEGTGGAGEIIETFGVFVVGGSYVVGIVIFLILTLINFVVITRGSGRIAEVSARFTLDALPGKQMSIDSDLASGLITQPEAKARRQDLANEADFYGAMDGSSKFVRGDAIAGLVITAINIIGGLIIGVAQNDMSVGDAATTYTILTIGDGLVAQIPALLVSTAAGVVVTRTDEAADLGGQISFQLFSNPKVLVASAVGVGGLMMVPGMPVIGFGILMGSLLYRAKKAAEEPPQKQGELGPIQSVEEPGDRREDEEGEIFDLLPVQALQLEVGYGLIPLVDAKESGEIIKRVTGLRKNMARDLGLVLPPLHLKDNLELDPGEYRLMIHGVEIVRGSVMPDRLLAMDPGDVRDKIDGIETVEPAFGLPAIWIRQGQRSEADLAGYTVVQPAAVVVTHISEAIQSEAHQLIGREALQDLLDVVAHRSPKVVDELIPNVLSHAEILAVLRNLLKERVSIRDLRTILETLAEASRHSKTTYFLAESVRERLGPAVVQSLCDQHQRLHAAIFDAASENALRSVTLRQENDVSLAPDLAMAQRLLEQLQEAVTRLHEKGHEAVIVTPADLRYALWKFASRFVPQLQVIGQNELPARIELITEMSMNVPSVAATA